MLLQKKTKGPRENNLFDQLYRMQDVLQKGTNNRDAGQK